MSRSCPFEYPVCKKTADKALAQFPSFAANASFMDVFQKATVILYGPNYKVKMDLCKRMVFTCMACNKVLNNTMSLRAHDQSANHLKVSDQASSFRDDYYHMDSSAKANNYPVDSIEYHILRSNIKILGVHLLEQYTVRPKQQPYYKCILCGAHGKREAIYMHVIGDKHTDKYIKCSIEIERSALSSEERNNLRLRLFQNDGLPVDKIKTITDWSLYPQKWEDEGLCTKAFISMHSRRKRGPSEYNKSSRYVSKSSLSSLSSRLEYPSKSSSRFPIKTDTDSFKRETPMDIDDEAGPSTETKQMIVVKVEPKVSQTPGGVTIHRDTGTSKSDQMVQVYTSWPVNRCLMKMNFLNHTHKLRCSGVYSNEDAKMCLELMFSTGNLLYYILNRRVKDSTDDNKDKLDTVNEAVQRVRKMLGSVKSIMAAKWDSDNPNQDCLKDTRAAWAS